MRTSASMVISSGAARRTRVPSSNGHAASCSVDGCAADLSKCREYHKRHKVCETHSKTPIVMVGGIDQRFCQQCSRFHALGEFDEGKRSCRKRLDGHNRRRRKPQLETLINPTTLLKTHQGTRISSHSLSPPLHFPFLQQSEAIGSDRAFSLLSSSSSHSPPINLTPLAYTADKIPFSQAELYPCYHPTMTAGMLPGGQMEGGDLISEANGDDHHCLDMFPGSSKMLFEGGAEIHPIHWQW